MIDESVDRRVLGGITFTDAITNTAVLSALSIRSSLLQLQPNRSGVYVVFDGPAFHGLTLEFNPAPASWPPPQSFEVTVQDPSLNYLGRRVQIQAPQPLTSTAPQTVALYPAAAARTEPNWAVIRASVTGTSGAGLPWAVVQAIKSDNTVAATGVTDARGEALLAVPGLGIQVSADGSGSVTEVTIPVTVQAWFDPTVQAQPAGWVPNPDDILGNLSNPQLKTGKTTGALGPQQTLFAKITIAV